MVSKIACLTIDDAPSADFDRKVDFLYNKGIPAVFFCLGESLEDHPGAVVEAIQKGFVIGNHSYQHCYFSDLPLEACFEQIQKAHDVIEHIYNQAGKSWERKYFRFPYGDKGGLRQYDVFSPYEEEGTIRKQALQNNLKELGYTQPKFEGVSYEYFREAGLLTDIDWHWTYDVREWGLAFPDQVLGINTLEKVFTRMDANDPEHGMGLNDPGSEEIILMHDHVETTHVFAIIVERLIEKGLQFRLPE